MKNVILKEIGKEKLSASDEQLMIQQALLSKFNINEDLGDIADLEDSYVRMFYF